MINNVATKVINKKIWNIYNGIMCTILPLTEMPIQKESVH